jgi:membrane-associated phospholipid phosphatase
MPLLVLILVALVAACAGGFAAWRYPRLSAGSPAPAIETGRKVGEVVAKRASVRSRIAPRFDPQAATGLGLTIALLMTIGGGVGLGALAYLERTNAHLNRLDRSVGSWGFHHSTALSNHGLRLITQLGAFTTIVVLCLVVAIVETVRTRSAWILPFLVVVLGGEEVLTISIKNLADRARPSFDPAAVSHLGPSFPSGHSATAAAFYAGAALLIGRRRGHAARAALTGLAVGIAVAVAASRVLLDVHWLSDVIAGLLLGWAWFAACAIAFGGRLLRFGAPAEAAQVAAATPSLRSRASAHARSGAPCVRPEDGFGARERSSPTRRS